MPNNFVSPNQGRAKSHFRGVKNPLELLSNNSLGNAMMDMSMSNSNVAETDRGTN